MASLRSVADSLSRKRARIRSRGLGEVMAESWGKVRSNIRSDDELIFLRARTDRSLEETFRKTDEPMQLVRATVDDRRDYERFIGTDSARTFAARLSDETRCWLVRARGAILHATWTTTGSAWTSEIHRYFVPPPSSAYVYESFTRAEARGLGLYPFALVGIRETLATEGVKEMFVGVEANNAPSLRAIAKAGFERAFTVPFHRRWGRVSLDDPEGPNPELAALCLRPS